MSVDDPPNNYFNGIGYNSLFYVKDTTGLTKANGDTYYLSKVNTDISTAPLTTFNGQVSINNVINLNALTYSLATAQTHLGYYLKSSGSPLSLTATQVFSTLQLYTVSY